MTEPQSTEPAGRQDKAEELAKSAAEIRALAERLGALPPGEPKVYSLRRARLIFAGMVAFVIGIGWFAWSYWHSLFVLLATLFWIFGHAWRYQRRARANAGQSSAWKAPFS